jgi:hypothetical protein
MRRLPPLAALGVVLVLAACGGGAPKAYTAVGTKACLVTKGFTGVTTAANKVGFIAAFAANGGLHGRSPQGNVLTIAFAQDTDSAAGLEKEYRRAAPARLRPHIGDIMSAQRNAVLVWTVSPSQQELTAAQGCLAG